MLAAGSAPPSNGGLRSGAGGTASGLAWWYGGRPPALISAVKGVEVELLNRLAQGVHRIAFGHELNQRGRQNKGLVGGIRVIRAQR